MIAVPGVQILRRFALRALTLDRTEFRLDSRCDGAGDLVLHREDVREVPVVAFGPDLISGRAIDQLGRDACAIACPAEAALRRRSSPPIPAPRVSRRLIAL